MLLEVNFFLHLFLKSRLFIGLSSALLLLLAGEWISRTYLGLGTPPLYISDPYTEYRLKPNQHLTRFGNRIDVNAASMRSEPLVAIPDPLARRLLVFGDSVVWGGSVLDQDLIATNVFAKLSSLEVGNVSAPSWGPGNWLGYARHYGFFQATDVVLVISSHDAADNPASTPFNGDSNHPLKPPISALAEGFQRYLLPRLGLRLEPSSSGSTLLSQTVSAEPTSTNDPRVKRGLADLRAFIHLARSRGARVAAVQFADREEAQTGRLQPGNRWIAELLRSEAVPSIQAGPVFRSCGPIPSLYSDGIHPYTAPGQACLAKAIGQALSTAKPS